MNVLVVDLLYCLAATIIGAAAAWWLWWPHFRPKASTHGGAEVHHAAEVAGNNEDGVPESKGRQQGRPAPCEPEKKEKAGPSPDAGAANAKPGLPRTVELDAVSRLPGLTIFCQQVQTRIEEWKRGGPTFAVALIEVDQFQQDGGQRSRQFATRMATGFLTATVREPDRVVQYGPGRFALLLPAAELADAIGAAQRLRAGFSEHSPTTAGVRSGITLSVGVVQVTEKDDSSSLFKRAEAALDAANRGGSNRTYYHDSLGCHSATWRGLQ